MKKRNKIILGIIALLVLLLSFNWKFTNAIFSIVKSKLSKPDLIYVKKSLWAHDSGFRIGQGDFVSFPENDSIFSLRGDTIYYTSKPRAIVKHTNKYLFEMEVTSLTGEKGTYIDTEESLH